MIKILQGLKGVYGGLDESFGGLEQHVFTRLGCSWRLY